MTDMGNLAAALAGCDEQRVKTLVREKLDAGVPAADVLAECNQGMVMLGNRFAEGECYIPELMFGGMIMKSVSTELGTALESSGPVEPVGKVVMGTVLHDVHDIGKDIVVMMLRGIGFEVIDLGVDVPPEKFVEAIREHQPQVAGLSVLLTTCYQAVLDTVAAIRDAGVRDGLKLMVGGAAASQLLAESAGCDFYGKTAVDGVKFAGQVVGVN
jgi:5-methyltetrahydrofolate--homocysteine methyltransferase